MIKRPRIQRRRGGIASGTALTSANIAPVVAGALALMAAGLLIGFSVWAQKVVLEETLGASVHANGRTQSGAEEPLVVENLAQITAPNSPLAPSPDGTPAEPVQISFVPAETPAEEPADIPQERQTRQPDETRTGHIGAPHPGTAGRVARRSESDCPPRRVRGADKADRIQPPGHCRNGGPAGAVANVGAAHATSASANSGERSGADAPPAPQAPEAPQDHPGNGHAYGLTKDENDAQDIGQGHSHWSGHGGGRAAGAHN